jgi:hypothetical protein
LASVFKPERYSAFLDQENTTEHTQGVEMRYRRVKTFLLGGFAAVADPGGNKAMP